MDRNDLAVKLGGMPDNILYEVFSGVNIQLNGRLGVLIGDAERRNDRRAEDRYERERVEATRTHHRTPVGDRDAQIQLILMWNERIDQLGRLRREGQQKAGNGEDLMETRQKASHEREGDRPRTRKGIREGG